MRKISLLSLFLLIVPSAILLVLSYGYTDRSYCSLPHALYAAAPWIAVSAAIAWTLWFWPCKRTWAVPLLTCAVVYAAAITRQNIALSQELDQIAMFSKQADSIHSSDRSVLEEKTYPKECYGDYAAGLQYLNKSKVYFEKEQANRNQLMQVVNFESFYHPSLLDSPDALRALREEIDSVYKKLRSQYRQAHNYYCNLIRIFTKSKWKNSYFKGELAKHLEPQSEIRLEFYRELYTNLRDQLFLFDDMVLFFLNRQGYFTRDEKGKILFNSEIDTIKYQAFCRDIDALFESEENIVNKYNEDMTLAI